MWREVSGFVPRIFSEGSLKVGQEGSSGELGQDEEPGVDKGCPKDKLFLLICVCSHFLGQTTLLQRLGLRVNTGSARDFDGSFCGLACGPKHRFFFSPLGKRSPYTDLETDFRTSL